MYEVFTKPYSELNDNCIHGYLLLSIYLDQAGVTLVGEHESCDTRGDINPGLNLMELNL